MSDDQHMLLRVARNIPEPFSLNQLVVTAWEAHPDIFGMPDYPYPDKHKVHELVYGKGGMISSRSLRKTATGLLCVSDIPENDANSL